MRSLSLAIRSLLKSPAFTAVSVFTIAIGIAADTAMFSIFSTLVLHPIDLPDAGRIVRIWTDNRARGILAPVMSVPKYKVFVSQQTAFSGIAASTFNAVTLAPPNGTPEQLTALNVTASFVPTLALPIARGRNFSAEEDGENGPRVCILSYEVWTSRFGQRADIVGQTIQLDGQGTVVVGVLAKPMPSPISGVQVLIPRPLSPAFLTPQQIQGGAGFLQITARLKPGVSFAKADAEVRAISKRYAAEYPTRLDATNENLLRTWIEEQVGPVRPTLVLLLGAVALVMLIACANVSNLFLNRLSVRHKDIAVRLALGAERVHVIKDCLAETLVFCVAAAATGLGLATLALRGAEQAITNQLQASIHFSIDGATLAATIVLATVSALLIGLVPAFQATRANLADVLKDTSRGSSAGRAGVRMRSVLIVAEVALSAVLLVGSSLLLVSFIRLQSTPSGFVTRGIATAFFNPGPPRYPTPAQQIEFFYQTLEQLRANPQVASAAVVRSPPLSGNAARAVYVVEGRSIPPLSERPVVFTNAASEGYFSMMGIPIKAGRDFQSTDRADAPLVCVINESFAKELFPGENPIGHVLLRGQNADLRFQIVGVVGDVKTLGLNTPPPQTMYLPLRQAQGGAFNIVVSTRGDPSALQGVLRTAVAAVDRTQPVAAFQTMDRSVAQSLGVQRVTAWLTGAFALIALVLSVLGLYSVLAYVVTQRVAEIGIRMALGAQSLDVIRLVVSQGMRLVLVGLVIGLGAAAAGGRAVASLLYEVKPLDPLIFASVVAVFGLVALAACFIPARRASRIDALLAIRGE
jgi:predicted permease